MKRNPQLDLLRGLAVLMVICCHYPVLPVFFRTGWAGVDLFFVLSGFLISGLLFIDWKRNEGIDLPRFYIRRGFKIYPAFFVFIALTIPIRAPAYHANEFGRRLLIECTFMQDLFPHLWGHTWSLGIEEKFYLALPVLLVALSALWPSTRLRGFRLIPYGVLSVMAICLWLRLSHPELPGLLTRCDGLFVGVAIGYWFHFHPESFTSFSQRKWLLPASILMLLPLALYGTWQQGGPTVITANAIAFGLLLCWALGKTALRFRPLELVGFYSYSIYLWHAPIGIVAKQFALSPIGLAVTILLSCAVGIAMSKALEVPVLAFRDRLFPSERAIKLGRLSRPMALTARFPKEQTSLTQPVPDSVCQ